MTKDEKRIFNLFADINEKNKFKAASQLRKIRGQLGLKGRTQKGMQVAGRYLDKMEEIFENMDLPKILARMPYVESSFNLNARSKVGASGIWQFMRSSGRYYGLKINRVIDERNDPLKATRAAARMLKRNFEKLGSWPLTVTSYNFGLGNIQRAIRKTKTKNLGEILKTYRGRSFGFASSNFYASFLAAVHVDLNYKKYFGEVSRDSELNIESIEIGKMIKIPDLVKYTPLTIDEVKKFNPSLSRSTLRGAFAIPKIYQFQIPAEKKSEFLSALEEIPGRAFLKRQIRSKTHRVRKGESLYLIAKKYGVSFRKLLRVNGFGSQSQIMPGQKIRIP